MNFMTKKAPIVNNSQRSFKRTYTLHFALLLVSIATILLKAFSNLENPLDLAFKSFLLLAVGAIVSVIVELFYALSEKNTSKFESYKGYVDPINTGLIIALLLPSITPIYVLILAVVVGVYAGKLVFGGYGYYIFNPALVGVLFAQLSFSGQLAVGDTPLQLLKNALNGVTVNFDLFDLFVGNYEAVAIGSTSVILLLGLLIYLIVTKVIDFRISGTFLLSVLVISFGIGYINYSVPGDLSGVFDYVIVNMVTGLTFFGAVFLISETVSSPTSRETKIVYAVVVAVLMMTVRVLGDNTEGLIFAVLFGNMITPFINRTVRRSNKKALIKTLVLSLVFILIASVALGLILQDKVIDVFALVGGVM